MEEAKYNGWARVEVMGHSVHVGKVTTEAFGGAVMFRVDSPAVPKRQQTIESTGYYGMKVLTAGTVLEHDEIPAATVLLGASAIFRLTPISEELALQEIIRNVRVPFTVLSTPIGQLPAPEEALGDDDEGDDDDPFGCAEDE